jgi:hypothetical protein
MHFFLNNELTNESIDKADNTEFFFLEPANEMSFLNFLKRTISFKGFRNIAKMTGGDYSGFIEDLKEDIETDIKTEVSKKSFIEKLEKEFSAMKEVIRNKSNHKFTSEQKKGMQVYLADIKKLISQAKNKKV